MANDKNPTEQLRTRIPATHSERNKMPSDSSEVTGNPWDALQDQKWTPLHRRSPRTYKVGTLDWTVVLVWLGLGVLIIGFILMVI